MGIIGQLPRTKNGNVFVGVMTDRLSKMTSVLCTSKKTAKHVANVFLDNYIVPYGISDHLARKNDFQSLRKFFATICELLSLKHLKTTAYHPQTSGQVKRYNKKTVMCLRHYVTEHQDDWEIFVRPLPYAYNKPVSRSTGVFPFRLVLSRHPIRAKSLSDTFSPQFLRIFPGMYPLAFSVTAFWRDWLSWT